MISIQFSSPIAGGGTVTATLHGLAAERDALVHEGTDAILAARARLTRVTSPFGTPRPIAPVDEPQDAVIATTYPCENPDPEGRVA